MSFTYILSRPRTLLYGGHNDLSLRLPHWARQGASQRVELPHLKTEHVRVWIAGVARARRENMRSI